MGPTEKLRQMADDLGVGAACRVVLEDARFPVWSGSSKPVQHHYGRGGLAKHTLEVAELCLANNEMLGGLIDRRQLFLSAVFHDAGKMWDYEPADGEEWRAAAHKRLVHHISRSGLVWCDAARANAVPADDVLHAILAHHGLREWGSPVMPRTRLAWMLHLCDGISARMDDAERWDLVKR